MKMPAATLPIKKNATAIATPTSKTSSRSISLFAGSGIRNGSESTVSGGSGSACEIGSKECMGFRQGALEFKCTPWRVFLGKTKGVAFQALESQSRYPSIVPRYKEKVESNVIIKLNM